MLQRLLLACVVAGALVGCNNGGVQTAGPAFEGAATAPAELTEAVLSPRAYLSLDKVPPAVAKPTHSLAEQKPAAAVQEPLAKADALYKEKKFSAAAAELEKANRQEPNSLPVRRLLGLTYVAMGDFAKAAPHLQAVADAAGDDAQVQMLLGRFAQNDNRSDQAVQRFRTSLICSDANEASPVFGQTLLGLAEELQRQGYLAAALEVYNRLSDCIDRNGDAYAAVPSLRAHIQQPELLLVTRGQLLLILRRYKEAAEVLDAAYRENKDQVESGALLVKALVAAGNSAAAEQVLLDLLNNPATQTSAEDLAMVVFKAKKDAAGPARLLAAYQKRFGEPPPSIELGLASAAYRLGSTPQAIAMLSAYARLVPSYAPAALRLARWQLADGKTAEAFDALMGLMEKDAKSAPAVRSLIQQTAPKLLPDEFVRSFVARTENDAPAAKAMRYYLAALAYQRTGQKLPAAEQFQLAIAAKTDFAPAYEALAANYLDRKEGKKLESLVELARRNTGDSAITLYLQGQSLYEKGDDASAIQSLQKAVALDESHVAARVLLSRAYVREKRMQDAEKQLKAAVALADDDQAYEGLMLLYLNQDNANAAEALVDQLLRRDHDSVLGLRLKLQLQIVAHQVVSAQETMRRLLALAPQDNQLRLVNVQLDLRGSLQRGYIGKARFERASADAQEILKSDPQDLEARILLAKLYSVRGKHAEAAEALAKAYQANPKDSQLPELYARELQESGRAADAAEVLRKRFEQTPDSIDAFLDYTSALAEAKKYGQAIDLLEKWIASHHGKDATVARIQLADIEPKANRIQQAQQLLAELLKEHPQDEFSSMIRAAQLDLLVRQRQFDKLEQAAHDWAQQENTNPGGPIALAMGLLAKEKQFDRLESFARQQADWLAGSNKAKAVETAVAIRLQLVQIILTEAGQKARARALFDSFLAKDPNNIDLLVEAQMVYSSPADTDRVIGFLERARKVEPENALACNNLGYILAEKGVRLDEAESLVRVSDAHEPQANVKDSLGWVKYKQGDFLAALDFMRQALDDVEGDHPLMYDHIGDVYWRLGFRAKAVAMWAEAADLAAAELEYNPRLTDEDVKAVAQNAPKKVRAALGGKQPPVAPLGEGVTP